ncbi:glycoside hydrolase family 28 protein [Duganella sp. P38]|uniref:glycoside hydrolase family 28 protein n=1 Tax=Duganella sp. P38 TaxID=3423949 RepID=UPI003D7B2A69
MREPVFNPRRRRLVRSGAGVMAGMGLPLGVARAAVAAARDPWAEAEAISARCKQPIAFRQQDFVITAYGARPCEVGQVDGLVEYRKEGKVNAPKAGAPDSYGAIRAAIDACHAAGGGRVVIPAGNWLSCGPLVLRSNVHVHLAAGAHLYFNNNPLDYARDGDIDCGPNGKLVISRWQSNDCLNYSPLVYAYGQENIALTGDEGSVIDGMGGVPFKDSKDCWWGWAGRKLPGAPAGDVQSAINPRNPETLDVLAPSLDPALRRQIEGGRATWRSDHYFLPALSEAGVPVARRVFGIGHFLRPCMVQFIGCTNVLLQGYRVEGAPFWLHHPVNCRNVWFRNVQMDSMGPNSDGFDPDGCDHVLVEGCTFNTGDDCIAIKSGKNLDTRFGPSRNIVIQDCVMNSGHGGVTLGSEMAAGIENVYVQNIEFRNVHWASNPLWSAIRLKTNMNRGGYLRHLYARKLTLPNGVKTQPMFSKRLPDSEVGPDTASAGGGAVIVFDCDYAPADDVMRIRPPQVSDVHISGIRAGNVQFGAGQHSCYQAFVLLGPLATSYNGDGGKAIMPITNVSISDSDFGAPSNTRQPWFIHNVAGLKLSDVRIAGKTYNTTLSR